MKAMETLGHVWKHVLNLKNIMQKAIYRNALLVVKTIMLILIKKLPRVRPALLNAILNSIMCLLNKKSVCQKNAVLMLL